MSAAGATVTRSEAGQVERSPWFRGLLWVAFGLLAIAFFVLALAAHTVAYFPLDLQAARAVQAIPAPWFHTLMMAVSWPGFPPQAPVFIGVVVLGCLLAHRRRQALYIAASGIGIALLGQLVKMLVNRPRPPTTLIHVWDPGLNNAGWSFPAGHTESYMAVLGFIFFLAYTSRAGTIRRAVTLFFTGAMILLIGVSRVDSGDHWLSDVVGAYLLGGLWLAVLIYVYQHRQSPASENEATASARRSRSP
jgi:undecaprenyl-diphosphatase